MQGCGCLWTPHYDHGGFLSIASSYLQAPDMFRLVLQKKAEPLLKHQRKLRKKFLQVGY
jgi:hypothetical protein